MHRKGKWARKERGPHWLDTPLGRRTLRLRLDYDEPPEPTPFWEKPAAWLARDWFLVLQMFDKENRKEPRF